MTLYTLYLSPPRDPLLLLSHADVGLAGHLTSSSPWSHGHDRFIAYEAHLVGAAFGFCYKQFDLRWSRLVDGRFRRPRLKIFTPVPFDQSRSRAPALEPVQPARRLSPKSSSVSVLPEEQLDARLDEVLAKIAREGRGGLTDEDQRVLQEASRRARNKRSDRH